jgi:hypothetical protein
MVHLTTRRWRSCRRSSGPKSTDSTLHPAHREGLSCCTQRTRYVHASHADTRVATEKLAVVLRGVCVVGDSDRAPFYGAPGRRSKRARSAARLPRRPGKEAVVVHLFHVATLFQRPCKEAVGTPRRHACACSAGVGRLHIGCAEAAGNEN